MYIIIAILVTSFLFFTLRTYMISSYKNPDKALKHSEIYYNEMLYDQAKVTLKRALKYNPNNSELIARLEEYELKQPNK